MDRFGMVHPVADDPSVPKTSVRAVPVPGDLARSGRQLHLGGDYIQVSVIVQVSRIYVPYRYPVDNVREHGPLFPKIPCAVIGVPGNLIVQIGGREHVLMPIIIQIGRMDRSEIVGRGTDDVPVQTFHIHIIVGTNFIIPVGSGEHVQVPVIVQIRCMDGSGAPCSSADRSLIVGQVADKIPITKIFVPGDLVIPGRGREYVQIPIAVKVRRMDRSGINGCGTDYM